MAKCFVCGKLRMAGHTVSHANNITKRMFKPNIQTVRARVNGRAKQIDVCTRCLRSGKVEKAVRGGKTIASAAAATPI